MLGISTKSYLHTGEIRGYAKTIGGGLTYIRAYCHSSLSPQPEYIIGSYVFFHKYMEVNESSLSDIHIFTQNRDYCGKSHPGRNMRKTFIMLVIVMPKIFRKQEVIPAYKFKKLSPRLLFGVKLIFYTM